MLGIRPVICTAITAKLHPANNAVWRSRWHISPKNETGTRGFTYAFSLSVHLSSLQVARGYDVPLNSHYECRNHLHQMGSQMKSQLNLSLNFEPTGAAN